MTWRIVVGDALECLRKQPDGLARCCVTSPPYWGLRDYGVDDQIGLEPTPEEYVARLLAVFHELRRVLADDGTLWLNLGDSYAGSWGAQSRRGDEDGVSGPQIAAHPKGQTKTGSLEHTPGLKPKDLVGVPWRVAFALQADGWWLRSDIIWSKPNPMPESVTDRPTKAHEYLFLLSKRERYYYDAEAIAELVTGNAHPRGNGVNPKARIPMGWDTGAGSHREKVGRYKKPGKNSGVLVDRVPRPRKKQNPSFSAAVTDPVERRNARSVWTIATEAFPEAHFATFPQALVEPCILAGSEPGDMVLDPFVGSGTVGVVALRHGRGFVGIDLSPEYAEMSRHRIAGPLFQPPEANADTRLGSSCGVAEQAETVAARPATPLDTGDADAGD